MLRCGAGVRPRLARAFAVAVADAPAREIVAPWLPAPAEAQIVVANPKKLIKDKLKGEEAFRHKLLAADQEQLLGPFSKVKVADPLAVNRVLHMPWTDLDQLDKEMLLREPVDLEEYFAKKDVQRSLVNYNRLIRAQGAQLRLDLAVQTFKFLRDSKNRSLWPDIMTYAAVMQACALAGQVDLVFRYYEDMKRWKIVPNEYIYGILINTLGTVGQIRRAVAFITDMARAGIVPNQTHYTALIEGCVRAGLHRRAWEVFHFVRTRVGRPDEVLMNMMLFACSKSGNVPRAQRLMEEMDQRGWHRSVSTYNALLSVYANSTAYYDEGMRTFERMVGRGVTPNTITYQLLMKLCSRIGAVQMCLRFFKEMTTRGVLPTAEMYTAILHAYSMAMRTKKDDALRNQYLAEAKEVFEKILADIVEPTVEILTAYLSIFCRAGRIQRAEETLTLFEKYKLKRPPQAYALMLGMYAATRRADKAFGVYEDLKRSGHPVEYPMYTKTIFALCRGINIPAERIRQAVQVLKECHEAGYDPMRFHVRSLLYYLRERKEEYPDELGEVLRLCPKPDNHLKLVAREMAENLQRPGPARRGSPQALKKATALTRGSQYAQAAFGTMLPEHLAGLVPGVPSMLDGLPDTAADEGASAEKAAASAEEPAALATPASEGRDTLATPALPAAAAEETIEEELVPARRARTQPLRHTMAHFADKFGADAMDAPGGAAPYPTPRPDFDTSQRREGLRERRARSEEPRRDGARGDARESDFERGYERRPRERPVWFNGPQKSAVLARRRDIEQQDKRDRTAGGEMNNALPPRERQYLLEDSRNRRSRALDLEPEHRRGLREPQRRMDRDLVRRRSHSADDDRKRTRGARDMSTRRNFVRTRSEQDAQS